MTRKEGVQTILGWTHRDFKLIKNQTLGGYGFRDEIGLNFVVLLDDKEAEKTFGNNKIKIKLTVEEV